jgi:hypothetical protein
MGAPPSATKDIRSSTSTDGRSVRKDLGRQPLESPPAARGTGGTHAGTPRSSPSGVDSRTVYKQQAAFRKRKKELPGRVHQPMSCLVRGTTDVSGSGVRCMYKKCRGLKLKSKKRVSYKKTIYQCEECTAERASPLWLCHTTKKINGKHTVVSCHLRYHAENKFIVIDSTESSVVSDLAEE